MKAPAPPPFDERPFVRLDHGMPENPKIVGLSDAAFRLWIEALCWCSRQESDGLITEAALRRLGRPRHVTELVTVGLLDELEIGGGYALHDYLVHQRSRSEIAAFRESRSDRGVKGNHKRWHVARRKYDPKCELCIAAAIANGSPVRSLNRPSDIADTDTDSDAEDLYISPLVDGDEEPSSSSSPSVTRGAANG